MLVCSVSTTTLTLEAYPGFTERAIEGIAEVPRYVRPKVTAGDGTTSLTATLVLRCTP